jgi:hypothetical protein
MTIMDCLSNFRPSDRQLLSRELANEETRDFAVLAVKEFVVRWEQADWLDEGSIARIGRWLGTYQSADVAGQLIGWANAAPSAARAALVAGIEEGFGRKTPHA